MIVIYILLTQEGYSYWVRNIEKSCLFNTALLSAVFRNSDPGFQGSSFRRFFSNGERGMPKYTHKMDYSIGRQQEGRDTSSIVYYNNNSQIFYDRTINSNMESYYTKFIPYLPTNASILDLGCGVGRDAHYFENLGYQVTAVDGSVEMVKLATPILKSVPRLMLFHELNFSKEFDAIWAAASLIHVSSSELRDIIEKIYESLKPGGVFFATFKHGSGQHTQEGRTFYYMTEEELRPRLEGKFEVLEIWKKDDSTSLVAYSPDKQWLNILVRKL